MNRLLELPWLFFDLIGRLVSLGLGLVGAWYSIQATTMLFLNWAALPKMVVIIVACILPAAFIHIYPKIRIMAGVLALFIAMVVGAWLLFPAQMLELGKALIALVALIIFIGATWGRSFSFSEPTGSYNGGYPGPRELGQQRYAEDVAAQRQAQRAVEEAMASANWRGPE